MHLPSTFDQIHRINKFIARRVEISCAIPHRKRCVCKNTSRQHTFYFTRILVYLCIWMCRYVLMPHGYCIRILTCMCIAQPPYQPTNSLLRPRTHITHIACASTFRLPEMGVTLRAYVRFVTLFCNGRSSIFGLPTIGEQALLLWFTTRRKLALQLLTFDKKLVAFFFRLHAWTKFTRFRLCMYRMCK